MGQTETLRDFFAANALQAILNNPDNFGHNPWELSRIAYRVADAMLEVRSKNDK